MGDLYKCLSTGCQSDSDTGTYYLNSCNIYCSVTVSPTQNPCQKCRNDTSGICQHRALPHSACSSLTDNTCSDEYPFRCPYQCSSSYTCETYHDTNNKDTTTLEDCSKTCKTPSL